MIDHLHDLIQRRPELTDIEERLAAAVDLLVRAFRTDHRLLVCGNGGSAGDAEHIVGELVKGFLLPRPLGNDLAGRLQAITPQGAALAQRLQQGLPAISLGAHSAACTAVMNDLGAECVFAQQVVAYGRTGDVLLGISTSGNAHNVIAAAVTARAMGMPVIGLTGRGGGELAAQCTVLIEAPSTETPRIQEYHVAIYHALCAQIEELTFGRAEPVS